MAAEIVFCELLFLRAALVGAEPSRWGGEALRRGKQRAFKCHNGPCSNWIGRDDFDKLTPLLAKACTRYTCHFSPGLHSVLLKCSAAVSRALA